MRNLLSYVMPNFLSKRSIKSILVISAIQFIIAFMIFQMQSNPLIPKPMGIIREAWNIMKAPNFDNNFLSTLFFIIKGMGISIIISLVICYMIKIDALAGFSIFISKLRFLTYTGIVFVFTVMLHNSGQIKLWVLIFGIVPYFVTSLLSYIGDINEKEYQLCYTLKMNKWQTLYEVIIKGKLHLVIEVVRQNFAIAWMMITGVGAIAWSEGGLGTLLLTENKHLRMDRVFGILLIILLTGMFFDYLFSIVKVYLFPYTDTKRYEKLWVVRISHSLGKRKDFNHAEKK